jgi:hypothetical protein
MSVPLGSFRDVPHHDRRERRSINHQMKTGAAASFSCGEQTRRIPDDRETRIVKEPTPQAGGAK